MQKLSSLEPEPEPEPELGRGLPVCLPAWAPIRHYVSERLIQLSAKAAAPLSPLGPALAGSVLHFLGGGAHAIRERVQCDAHTLLLGSYWEDLAALGAPANGCGAAPAAAAPPEDIDAKLLVPRGKSGEAAAALFASIEAAAAGGACVLLGPAGGALTPFAPGAYDIAASGLPAESMGDVCCPGPEGLRTLIVRHSAVRVGARTVVHKFAVLVAADPRGAQSSQHLRLLVDLQIGEADAAELADGHLPPSLFGMQSGPLRWEQAPFAPWCAMPTAETQKNLRRRAAEAWAHRLSSAVKDANCGNVDLALPSGIPLAGRAADKLRRMTGRAGGDAATWAPLLELVPELATSEAITTLSALAAGNVAEASATLPAATASELRAEAQRCHGAASLRRHNLQVREQAIIVYERALKGFEGPDPPLDEHYRVALACLKEGLATHRANAARLRKEASELDCEAAGFEREAAAVEFAQAERLAAIRAAAVGAAAAARVASIDRQVGECIVRHQLLGLAATAVEGVARKNAGYMRSVVAGLAASAAKIAEAERVVACFSSQILGLAAAAVNLSEAALAAKAAAASAAKAASGQAAAAQTQTLALTVDVLGYGDLNATGKSDEAALDDDENDSNDPNDPKGRKGRKTRKAPAAPTAPKTP